MITATSKRVEGYRQEVEVDGHTIAVDEPLDAGGTDTAPSPTRLLAAALASCTAITITMYTERKGWEMDGLEVSVDFEGSPKGADTARFTVSLRLPEGLDEDQVDRIRTIAAKCPVHRTLTGRVEIAIHDDAGVGEEHAA